MRVILKYIVLAFLISFSFLAQAQAGNQVYRTRNGTVHVNIYKGDSLYRCGSNALHLVLDYETVKVFMHVMPSSFKTGNDSLDRVLSLSLMPEAEFEGKLDINQIKLQGNELQKFHINGDLTINGVTKYVSIEATLQAYGEGAEIQCMLYLHLILS